LFIWTQIMHNMYTILFFILSITPFVLFFILKNIFNKKETFLQKHIEQLDFEKEVIKSDLKKHQDKNLLLEKELVKNNKHIIGLQSELDRSKTENEALRKLITELQKNKKTKNDDITIEYLVKNQ
jgi:septal ring factor EnvC (AmiA/AmiB activator)